MNEDPTLKDAQTNWEALIEMEDGDIDLSELPEITADQIARATLRVGGKLVARGKSSPAVGVRQTNTQRIRNPDDSASQDITSEESDVGLSLTTGD